MSINIKVYYEDTDASGRVYYANYLKYLERGRTDFLYNLGFDHKNLLNKFNFFFVVKTCNIEYLKPANFEDILKVNTLILSFSKAKIEFKQYIYREKQLLIDSTVVIVSVNTEGKISKMPNKMLKILEHKFSEN